jgi:hypothetical protein
MKYLAWMIICCALTFSITRMGVLACSGEVEEAMTRQNPPAIKLPIDYRNTQKCKCCGGTGRIKVVPESR